MLFKAWPVPSDNIHYAMESVWPVESTRVPGIQSWGSKEFVPDCTWAPASRGPRPSKKVRT